MNTGIYAHALMSAFGRARQADNPVEALEKLSEKLLRYEGLQGERFVAATPCFAFLEIFSGVAAEVEKPKDVKTYNEIIRRADAVSRNVVNYQIREAVIDDVHRALEQSKATLG
jgi:hypothetical protein